MKTRKKTLVSFAVTMITFIMPLSVAQAIEFSESIFDREQHKVKYNIIASSFLYDDDDSTFQPPAKVESFEWETNKVDYKYKSPTKAFLLSLALPGLGQYYYGSRIRPLVYVGTEVVSWLLYTKWNSEGDDLTDAFQAYNLQNWSRSRYIDYLFELWGDSSDTDIGELTHRLPDDYSQQFFEMSGKYDQFAWGWEDAILNDRDMDTYIGDPNVTGDGDLQKITADSSTIPTTKQRFIYEQMRDDANVRYDKAKRMVYVAMFNHLVSAFEAYIVTRNHNRALNRSSFEFARLKVRASLKSVYARWDTPMLNLKYSF